MQRFFNKQNRALLSELVRTDFKLRYQGSVLGYAWSLLRPLLLFIILYVVFTRVFSLGDTVPHYPAYLLLGIVLWNFFTEMTTQSLGSIVARGDLIRKIRIPRWIIVLSTSISALINLLLNMIIVVIIMAINHVDPMRTAFFLPLILVEVYLLTLGVSLFLAAAFVKFRDIGYIWEVILQGAFYLTPILYPLSRITNLTFKKFIMINPMAQAMQDARYVVITHKTVTITQLFRGGYYEYAPFLLVIIVLASGLVYFRKQSKYFAENV